MCIKMQTIIDAEHTSIQLGIDYFTYSATVKYSKGEKPLFFLVKDCMTLRKLLIKWGCQLVLS